MEQQNQIQKTETDKKALTLKGLFDRDDLKKRFNEILGEKSSGFIASVLQLTSADNKLSQCDPMSIMSSAMIAATLDLPVNKNLGFSWIIPYGKDAQFQIGYKGFIQLALRTGQYKSLNVVEVYVNQFKSWNALTETLDADFTIDGQGEIVGYCAYFKLINDFEKTEYWSKEKVLKHAQRFSKTFKSGPWQSDLDRMSKKTVLKNTLAKWGILSTQMVVAQKADQAIILNDESGEPAYKYPDNGSPDIQNVEEIKPDPTIEKINAFTDKAKLMSYKLNEGANWNDDQVSAFKSKLTEFEG